MQQSDSLLLNPVTFFAWRVQGFYVAPGTLLGARHRLPSTAGVSSIEPFALVAFGWNEEGVRVKVSVGRPLLQTCYPKFSRGDSFELFLDTRDVKTSGYNTRFCHHFFFLPKPVEGISAGEVTAFRTEDAHEWCDSEGLKVDSQIKKGSYSMDIHISKSSLVGYDPSQFHRLGFNYRVNRAYASPQDFSVSGDEYDIGQVPSLWASMELKR